MTTKAKEYVCKIYEEKREEAWDKFLEEPNRDNAHEVFIYDELLLKLGCIKPYEFEARFRKYEKYLREKEI